MKKTEERHILFILVHSLLLEKLIQLSNPKSELDFHYTSRILTNNHNQSTILTLKKETKTPNTRVLCEYKPKRTLLLAQMRKAYSSITKKTCKTIHRKASKERYNLINFFHKNLCWIEVFFFNSRVKEAKKQLFFSRSIYVQLLPPQ